MTTTNYVITNDEIDSQFSTYSVEKQSYMNNHIEDISSLTSLSGFFEIPISPIND